MDLEGGCSRFCQEDETRADLSCEKLYTIAHPCIQPSKVGKAYARFSGCSFDFSIKPGGYDDVSKHVNLARHVTKEGCLKRTSTLSSFFQPSSSGYKGPHFYVIRAETLCTQFVVEHNILISAANHAGELFRKMFPGNPVPKQYACGCTKATAIVKECARDHMTNLANAMRNGLVVMGTDGSQEDGGKRSFDMKTSLTLYLVFYQIMLKNER